MKGINIYRICLFLHEIAVIFVFLNSFLLPRCKVNGAGFLISPPHFGFSQKIPSASSSSLAVKLPEDELVDLSFSSDSNSRKNTRRQFIAQTQIAASGIATRIIFPTALSTTVIRPAEAAVGTLPEFESTNAVLQGITIRVADQSQLKSMIAFLENGFDGVVLRRRVRGSIEEVWMGFGPEQLSIPPDFIPGVSSFSKYGGHASIRIVYDSKSTTAFYRTGDSTPPGDNIAYLQIAVPGYRISQMVASGAYIQDAYGYVNVISPSGLQVRGIVGIRPDPIMFVAVRCADVSASRRFYEQLGFVEQEYPYARPSNGAGPFEPAQPNNSVYLAPSPNSMGILLLPSPKTLSRITPNPAVLGLNVVFTPSSNNSDIESETSLKVVDPSGLGIDFVSISEFERE